jgi:UDP-N-acetylmuramoyl-tripeptide--D-alanyl-D-alanine ligase
VLPAATRANGVALFPQQAAEFAPFREQGGRLIVVEPAAVIRPAEPPKDRVYFAATHVGDSTALAVAYGPPPPIVFALRRVSDGMAQNAALAICAALGLGVPAALVKTRLGGWMPGKLRGEIRRDNGRMLYLDCYNANPASMADALATFVAIAPEDEPRLYVIGCMEELGAEAPAHHRRLGRIIPMRSCDRLFVIGSQAHEVCAGVLDQDDFTAQIRMVGSLEPVAEFLMDWKGPVFIKGSRRYQLEKVLELRTSQSLPC